MELPEKRKEKKSRDKLLSVPVLRSPGVPARGVLGAGSPEGAAG